MAELREVIRLDHQVFGDPLLDEAGLARELARLGVHRQLFFIPGENGTARAAGGWTRFPGWVLFWGAETHPDWRHQGLYRQILRARVEALEPESLGFIGVLANVDTSAPILRRLGFRSIGRTELWGPPTEKSVVRPEPFGEGHTRAKRESSTRGFPRTSCVVTTREFVRHRHGQPSKRAAPADGPDRGLGHPWGILVQGD